MERRLSAILAADVVGYSALMEQDEAGTFDRLRAHWTAESFMKWYKTSNIRDEDSAKLMEGIYKTGVLGPEAKPGM